MRKFEITVLAQDDNGNMILQDRCTISAADTADAARKYAELFGPGTGARQ